jgi:hypothetical protein
MTLQTNRPARALNTVQVPRNIGGQRVLGAPKEPSAK